MMYRTYLVLLYLKPLTSETASNKDTRTPFPGVDSSSIPLAAVEAEGAVPRTRGPVGPGCFL